MNLLHQSIERAISRYEALVNADPALLAELERTRSAFAAGPGAIGELGRRRHLEWFLFERPSEALQGVPVEALHQAWFEDADANERDVFEALLASYASAFVVLSIESGQGFVARDLFGISELAVIEPGAADRLEEADLLVGRIFPLGPQGTLLSPAVSCIRDENLLAALEHDVEQLRASRRGVLRIQQVELEQMFFLPGKLRGTSASAEDPGPATIDALTQAGLEPGAAAKAVAQITSSADGNMVTEVLNHLAFHTEVDLESAREALVALWATVTSGANGPKHATTPTESATREESTRGENVNGSEPSSVSDRQSSSFAPNVVGTDTSSTRRSAMSFFQEASRREEALDSAEGEGDAPDRDSVRAALENFDQGRAKGRDLEELFGQLESDLQLTDAAGDSAGDDGAPDFPGVVGAMVAEFRWEATQVRGIEKEPKGWRHLEAFAGSMQDLGIFEDLTTEAIIGFATRDALDRGLLSEPDDAAELVAALGAFATWCDEDQGLELLPDFEAVRDGLARNLTRLAAARRALDSAASGGILYEVAIVGGSRLALSAVAGGGGDDLEDEREVQVPEPLARHLEPGDLVRITGPISAGVVVGVHPPEARAALLESRS